MIVRIIIFVLSVFYLVLTVILWLRLHFIVESLGNEAARDCAFWLGSCAGAVVTCGIVCVTVATQSLVSRLRARRAGPTRRDDQSGAA